MESKQGKREIKRHAAAFKEQLVELHRAGRSVSDLSREFGCAKSTLAEWVRQAELGSPSRGEPEKSRSLSADERVELIELRRRLKQVQTERDILAKATAWFAVKSEKTFTSSTS